MKYFQALSLLNPMFAVLNPTDGELPERDAAINMKKILKEKGQCL